MKAVASARNRDEKCDICQANPLSGFGDCGEQIGLASEVAAALMEQDEDESSVAAN
jgi:hypothetical protein